MPSEGWVKQPRPSSELAPWAWSLTLRKRVERGERTHPCSVLTPVKGSVAQPCPTLCKPVDYRLPGSSSTEFSRQEYWSGLPCRPPGYLPDPEIKPRSPALQADSLLSEPLEGSPVDSSKTRPLPENFLENSCGPGGLLCISWFTLRPETQWSLPPSQAPSPPHSHQPGPAPPT